MTSKIAVVAALPPLSLILAAKLGVPVTAETWPIRKRVTVRMGVVNDSNNAVTLPIRLEATRDAR